MPEFINTFALLGEDFYSRTQIEPFESPVLVDVNQQLAKQLGLNFSDDEFLKYFSGQQQMKGSEVISTVYSGHQFGSYVPQLGDGRAHLLGEIKTPSGESFELQLKGSGKTPYSRFGDGKAVLRSSIREYLASETIHSLGIPTTRALCIIASDESVMREGIEKAAMITRVSPSFVRFGHFEYFTHSKKPELTKKLADYVIDKFFHDCGWGKDRYEKFLYEVVSRTAKLMAKWQAFGFAHGVMNTDNMSILGLTIDYGPYGFMDEFKPGFIPNSSDYTGRYSFSSQPDVALWNLRALAYALAPVIPLEASMPVLELYKHLFLTEYTDIMRKKLGLLERRNGDKILIQNLLELLANHEVDYTIFFRRLCDYKVNSADEDKKDIYSLFKNQGVFKEWEQAYILRLKQEGWKSLNKGEENSFDLERAKRMKTSNPKYILRNYLAENAIQQASFTGDFSEVKKLMEILSSPYEEKPENEAYAHFAPEWSRDICISCSS